MDPRVAYRFGRTVRACREHARLSQAALAERIELHRVEVSSIERGARLPRVDTILKLSAGVGVSPCVLLAGMHWQSGYYVAGNFRIDDDLEPDLGRKPGEK